MSRREDERRGLWEAVKGKVQKTAGRQSQRAEGKHIQKEAETKCETRNTEALGWWMDGDGEAERTSWEMWIFLTFSFGATELTEQISTV